jgi:hypothetical protein
VTPEEAAALRKEFPPSAIGKLPKAGVMLDYVGHAATTDRLLAVDPDWSWEPMARDERGLPALDEEGNLWITLTVCGVTRPGVGDGKTSKERIGDAIRNAAMRFGVALDLWAKEDLQSNGDGSTSILDRQKARIRARQEATQASDMPVASPSPSPSPGDAPAPTGNTVSASTRDKLATVAQKTKLNVLVGTLREERAAITTEDLWKALARERGVEVPTLVELYDDAYTPDGVLHWSPLRESLTRAEASDLIDRLERLEASDAS